MKYYIADVLVKDRERISGGELKSKRYGHDLEELIKESRRRKLEEEVK